MVSLEAPPQVYDVETGGSFADLGGSPPQAKYIWAAGDFVVLGYLKTGADEFPQDIHWSGLNDATYWTIDRRKGSDRQTLTWHAPSLGFAAVQAEQLVGTKRGFQTYIRRFQPGD